MDAFNIICQDRKIPLLALKVAKESLESVTNEDNINFWFTMVLEIFSTNFAR